MLTASASRRNWTASPYAMSDVVSLRLEAGMRNAAHVVHEEVGKQPHRGRLHVTTGRLMSDSVAQGSARRRSLIDLPRRAAAGTVDFVHDLGDLDGIALGQSMKYL